MEDMIDLNSIKQSSTMPTDNILSSNFKNLFQRYPHGYYDLVSAQNEDNCTKTNNNKESRQNRHSRIRKYNFEVVNSQMVRYLVDMETYKTGFELLIKICEYFNIEENYYFGLKFDHKVLLKPQNYSEDNIHDKLSTNNRYESMNSNSKSWINCRNRLKDTFGFFGITSSKIDNPLKLEFQIKFTPDPYTILLPNTKEELYYKLKNNHFNGFIKDNRTLSCKKNTLDALIAHIELSRDISSLEEFYLSKIHSKENYDETIKTFLKHKEISKLTKKEALWRFVIECYTTPTYGVDFFANVQLSTTQHKLICYVLINKNGIQIIESVNNRLIKYVLLDQLSTASLSDRKVIITDIRHETLLYELTLLDSLISSKEETNYESLENLKIITLKLQSSIDAMNLYRSITEHHVFFLCDQVKPEIKEQKFTLTSRKHVSYFLDGAFNFLKNSFFKNRNSLAKNYFVERNNSIYVFDTIKTVFEVQNSLKNDVALLNSLYKGNVEDNISETVQTSVICVICREAIINCLIEPCCHLSGCESCIYKCDKCPLCRGHISATKIVYITV